MGRQAVRAATLPAAVTVVGPPRHRRRRRGALQRLFWWPTHRHAPRPRIGKSAMANLIDVKVPDIGDFKNVSVIDVLVRSEEHTSELQSLRHLVCRLLLEKKKPRHCRTTG